MYTFHHHASHWQHEYVTNLFLYHQGRIMKKVSDNLIIFRSLRYFYLFNIQTVLPPTVVCQSFYQVH